jgi:tetratricopeptide (TPR) repeat protein
MARTSLAEDDRIVFIRLRGGGTVQLDNGRAIPLPDIPYPIRRSDLDLVQGTQELPLNVLVEGTLEALLLEDDPEKIEDYRRFLFGVEPNVDQLLMAEALTLAGEDRPEQARDRFDVLVHLCPDHALGWMNMGLCSLDLARRNPLVVERHREFALASFLRAVEEDERLAPAHFYIGCLFRDRGEHEAARYAWRHCVSLRPREDEVGRSARSMLARFEQRCNLDQDFAAGSLAVLEGRLDEGIRLLERVVSSRPGAWQACFFLGLALRLQGDYAGAHRAFRRVVTIRPDESEGWNERGLCELERGLLDESLQSLERARDLQPDNPRVLRNLGMLMLRRGASPEARQLFLEAQALDPEGLMARECLELVEEAPGAS